MNIKETAVEIHLNANEKGFWDSRETKNVGECLMLVVSEISEALEADRKGKRANLKKYESDLKFDGIYNQSVHKEAFVANIKDTFEDEIADAVIRLFDLSEGFGIDLETHIRLKMEFNKTRVHRHGKRY